MGFFFLTMLILVDIFHLFVYRYSKYFLFLMNFFLKKDTVFHVDFFFFPQVFIEFVTTLLLLYVSFFLALRHVGS